MAVEITTVHGRPAIVSYLNDRFQPVEQIEATLVKVTYTDDEGGMIFATVAKPEHEAARSG